MSGVDCQDQMNSYYPPFTGKTILWYKKLTNTIFKCYWWIHFIYITKITLNQKYYCIIIVCLFWVNRSVFARTIKIKNFLFKMPHLLEKYEVGKKGNYLKNNYLCYLVEIQKNTIYFCSSCILFISIYFKVYSITLMSVCKLFGIK